MNNKSKLFVGGLAWTTTKQALKCYFSQFGQLVDCVVMVDQRTGKSRGFGFVEYSNCERAEFVFKNGPHRLEGRFVAVKYRDKSVRPTTVVGSNTPRVFFGGLPQNVTESELRIICDAYGTTTDVVIAVKDEKRLTGRGFASFTSKSSAEALISKRFIQIKGKMVEVKRAELRSKDKALLEPFLKCPLSSEVGPGEDLMTFKSEDSESEESDSDYIVTVIQKL